MAALLVSLLTPSNKLYLQAQARRCATLLTVCVRVCVCVFRLTEVQKLSFPSSDNKCVARTAWVVCDITCKTHKVYTHHVANG